LLLPVDVQTELRGKAGMRHARIFVSKGANSVAEEGLSECRSHYEEHVGLFPILSGLDLTPSKPVRKTRRARQPETLRKITNARLFFY